VAFQAWANIDDDDIIYVISRHRLQWINLGATKVDLRDRAIIVELERIAKEKQCNLQDTCGWIYPKDSMKHQLLGFIFWYFSEGIAILEPA
jgi:hypothetical protein